MSCRDLWPLPCVRTKPSSVRSDCCTQHVIESQTGPETKRASKHACSRSEANNHIFNKRAARRKSNLHRQCRNPVTPRHRHTMVAPGPDHVQKWVHARSLSHIASQDAHEVGEEALPPDFARCSPLIVAEKGPEASMRTRTRIGPKAFCPEGELGGEPGCDVGGFSAQRARRARIASSEWTVP